jgi:DHA1 family bicyclomycin/chloramphenicol resistance-like MFS transporter
MTPKFLRTAVVLGLLSAIGPFAIDMYLPALPMIGEDLGAGTAAVQMSLLVFFLAMGFGQIVVGPVSDMVGRKAPLYGGLLLFAAGGVGSALAPTIEWLIAFRVIQGLGACAGMVVPRAIVRDLHTGTEAARLMSLLMLVFSVSPILAPLTGSQVIESFGWRAVFWVVTGAALVAIVLLSTSLKETRPAEQRVDSSFGSALVGYRLLLGDRNFLGLTFIGGFGISSFFVYLSNSSFILIDHYGLSPSVYSLFFSVNAVAFIGMSQLTGTLTERFGLRRVVRVAVSGYATTMVVLLAVTASGIDRLDVLAALLFVGYGFLGLVIPTTSVLAMEEQGKIAGTASAMMGTLHFATGASAMAVAGLFFDGTSLPMVVAIASCAVISFTLAQITLGRGGSAVEAEAPAE